MNYHHITFTFQYGRSCNVGKATEATGLTLRLRQNEGNFELDCWADTHSELSWNADLPAVMFQQLNLEIRLKIYLISTSPPHMSAKYIAIFNKLL